MALLSVETGESSLMNWAVECGTAAVNSFY